MTISSQFYNDTEGYWTGWQQHAQSVCFVLIACYYISVLYFLTMTAERANNNLRTLVTPLRQMLVETQDVSGTRIIGWGIRFKLQMLCPQEDE